MYEESVNQCVTDASRIIRVIVELGRGARSRTYSFTTSVLSRRVGRTNTKVMRMVIRLLEEKGVIAKVDRRRYVVHTEHPVIREERGLEEVLSEVRSMCVDYAIREFLDSI